MKKEKQVLIRVDEDTLAFLTSNFANASAGVSTSVDIVQSAVEHAGIDPQNIVTQLQEFKAIRRCALRELSGVFTPEEWKYMADSLNGTLITPEFRYLTAGLIASVEDSDHFDSLGTKWSVDTETLIKKIDSLSGAQVDAVYARIEAFWSNVPNFDLEEWAKY